MDIYNYIQNKDIQYSLPGDPDNDIYIVATSGGADSSSLCILLKELLLGTRAIRK